MAVVRYWRELAERRDLVGGDLEVHWYYSPFRGRINEIREIRIDDVNRTTYRYEIICEWYATQGYNGTWHWTCGPKKPFSFPDSQNIFEVRKDSYEIGKDGICGVLIIHHPNNIVSIVYPPGYGNLDEARMRHGCQENDKQHPNALYPWLVRFDRESGAPVLDFSHNLVVDNTITGERKEYKSQETWDPGIKQFIIKAVQRPDSRREFFKMLRQLAREVAQEASRYIDNIQCHFFNSLGELRYLTWYKGNRFNWVGTYNCQQKTQADPRTNLDVNDISFVVFRVLNGQRIVLVELRPTVLRQNA